MDEFEDLPLGDPRNQRVFDEAIERDLKGQIPGISRETKLIEKGMSKVPYFVASTAALAGTSYLIGKSMLNNRRDEELIEDKMSDFELERMALYKDMIQVQYDNRASLGSDMFKLTKGKTRNITPYTKERTQIAELTPEDKAKLNVGDYKFVEGGDLYALFENSDGKKVIAIRGLMPGVDKKDTAQLPRMMLQTIGKVNLDTDIQFKEDFAVVEDYLLSLPNYKDVVVTGHSRGGATALKLARKHTLEAHVFQPVTVMDIEKREGEAGTLSVDGSKFKVNKRHIYTNTEDYTPSNLMSSIDSRESHYLIEFDRSAKNVAGGTIIGGTIGSIAGVAGQTVGSLLGGHITQSIDAHQLHHFHKDAAGYVLQEKHKGEFAINRELEIIAKIEDIERSNNEDIPYDEDLYEIVYGTKEDINYIEEDYVNVKDMIIPTTREMVFSDIPFIPNNSTQIETNKMDTNGDGVVSYTEFFNYYKKLGYSTNRIKELFRSLDKNGDGVLSVNELSNSPY